MCHSAFFTIRGRRHLLKTTLKIVCLLAVGFVLNRIRQSKQQYLSRFKLQQYEERLSYNSILFLNKAQVPHSIVFVRVILLSSSSFKYSKIVARFVIRAAGQIKNNFIQNVVVFILSNNCMHNEVQGYTKIFPYIIRHAKVCALQKSFIEIELGK